MLEALITILITIIGTWVFLKKNSGARQTKDTKEIQREAEDKAYNSDINNLVDDVVAKFGSDPAPRAKNVASKKPEDPV